MWYVLQVSTGKEMAVASTLTNNQVLAYVPRENRLIRKGGGWSQKEYTLFPGYVFLNLDYTAENYYMVKAIPGVLRFLGPDGLHPSTLTYLEAEWIKLLAGEGKPLEPTAFDLMFYINNSDISKVFDDTPEAITAWICSHLGVPLGSASPTGVKVYLPWLGKKAYEAIMAAYTTASRQNGKKYIPLMQNVNQVYVIEKGALCGVVLDGGYNLTDAAYKTSLQKLVNRVIVTDQNGNQTSVVEDAGSQSNYGVVQRVYKQEEGKDAASEAKARLYTMDQSATVTATSDTRAVSGYAIAVQEAVTGLYGKFYIESDTHTFEDGKEMMQLTLAFSNIMDEKEAGS